ncbi:MAG: LysR family transcriptional regulator [Enterococcus sp.]
MNLKDLEYFHQLIEVNSFTKVAETFHVSQPTVTYALKRLEEELGTQLLIRDQSHRSLYVTPAGKVLDRHAKLIMNELAMAKIEINRLSNKKIELGLPSVIGNYYFPKLSVFLYQQNLLQKVSILNGGSEDIYQLLKNGQLDIALVGSTNPLISEHFTVDVLAETSFMIVTSPNHPLAKRKSLRFADLQEESFVLFNEHYIHPRVFKNLARQAHVDPAIVYQTNDLNILKGMIREEVGIGFLTEIAIDEKDNLVKIPLVDEHQPHFFISLVVPNKEITSDTEKVIENFIRQTNF